MTLARRLTNFFQATPPQHASRPAAGAEAATIDSTPTHYHLLGAVRAAEPRLPVLTAGLTKRRIGECLAQQDFASADHLYGLISHCYATEAYAALRQHQWAPVLAEITQWLATDQFDLADRLAAQAMLAYPAAEYAALRQPHWVRLRTEKLTQITTLLMESAFILADQTANAWAQVIDGEEYAMLRRHHWERRQAELHAYLAADLAAYRFGAADDLAQKWPDFIPATDYLHRKTGAVEVYFQQQLRYPVNIEQAHALAATACHLLVKARAGSGKTRTIVGKAAFVLEQERLHPNQVLLLAFNTDAATEMAKRLQEDFGYKNFVTARTFHSLAYQLVRPAQDIVKDKALEAVLDQAMTSVLTNRVYRLLAKAARGGDAPDESVTAALTPAEYLAYVRAQRTDTLSGITVKSQGEKWIADYLFAHDIPFKYEKVFKFQGPPYRPDFTLRPDDEDFVVWEHWGVPAHTPDDALIFGGPRTARDYRQEMKRKRARWAAEAVPFIETSVDDMRNGRAAFEAALAEKLAEHGIVGRQLSEEELQQKLRHVHLSRLAHMIRQFIQRAKSRRLDPATVERRVRTIAKGDKRTRIFWFLAARVYAAYERTLTQSNKMDFYNLLSRAADLVEATAGHCYIAPPGKDTTVWLNELRWLLVDEFQDFSPSFDHLITTIRRHNPDLKLFCVGDDWQSINGFAGAELTYFHDFTQRIPQAAEIVLRTNHRSEQAIVAAGNKLMANLGPAAAALPGKGAGQIRLYCLDALWLDLNPPENDKRFQPPRLKFDEGFKATRFLKFCTVALQQVKPQQRVVILARTNWLYGLALPDLRKELLKHLGKAYKASIDVSTVHSYKGLEADIAILADVTVDAFPLLHPDNDLYAPLYPDVDFQAQVLAEERRLFYVALTRAKEQLWILTETGRVSPFLRDLSLPVQPISTVIQQQDKQTRALPLPGVGAADDDGFPPLNDPSIG